MGLIRRTTIASSIAVAAVAVTAVPALAATPKVVSASAPPSKTNPQAKPKEIIYAGDGSALFAGTGSTLQHAGSIDWTSYGATQAVGQADNWLNNCKPDCAGGKFTGYPVTLTLSKPAVEHAQDIFTKMIVTYTGTRPSYVKTKTQTWTATYRKGIYIWNFPE